MKNLVYLHAFFMAATTVLVIAAAVVVFRKKKGWFMVHRNVAISAVVTAFLGFLAEFLLKASLDYPHFKSPHAIGGLLALTMLIITPATGLMIAKIPRNLRPVHMGLGRITLVAVIVVAIMGIVRFIQLSG